MIKIGTVLHLEVFSENSKNNGKQKVLKYKCRLVDQQKNILIVDQPIDEETGKNGHFYDGTEFNLWFVGTDGAIYSFKTQLLGRKRDNIPMFMLEDPGKESYMRTQRRNFVRVESSVDVAIHPQDPDYPPFRTFTIDISGGGLAISIPKTAEIPENGDAFCYLALPMLSGEIHYIKAFCKIIRVFKKESSSMLQASLQFKEITEKDRQKIINYCFECQLITKNKKENLKKLKAKGKN